MRIQNHKLQRGERLSAEIVELVAGSSDVVVSYQGHLIRVGNKTPYVFRIGQRIELRVASVSPLQFELQVERGRARLNVDV